LGLISGDGQGYTTDLPSWDCWRLAGRTGDDGRVSFDPGHSRLRVAGPSPKSASCWTPGTAVDHLMRWACTARNYSNAPHSRQQRRSSAHSATWDNGQTPSGAA